MLNVTDEAQNKRRDSKPYKKCVILSQVVQMHLTSVTISWTFKPLITYYSSTQVSDDHNKFICSHEIVGVLLKWSLLILVK